MDFEHSLNAAVKRLRAALGDDADNPRFVETLPRRGYRFIADLNAAESVVPMAVKSTRLRLAVLPLANLAMAYLALEDIDTAFELLDQAWLDRDPAIAGVNVEPRFEPLRADGRYRELLGRLNLG